VEVQATPKLPLSIDHRWFRPRAGADMSLPQLFCIGHAGAGAAPFGGWHDALSEVATVWPVVLPGRESRYGESAYTEMERLVPDLAGAISEVVLSDRVALFGHCGGALIAYECSRHLVESTACQPRLLIASDSVAPSRASKQRRRWHSLRDDELLGELARIGATPPEVLANRSLMALLLPALRADTALLHGYRPSSSEALDMSISVVVGTSDWRDRADIAAWAGHTSRELRVQWLDGQTISLGDTSLLDFVRGQMAAAMQA